jgi:predicted DCC family thiol-disulfide oxidoreductase YuxK
VTDETNILIILFDGYCNLCEHCVQFILKRDKKKRFRFLPSQSEKSTQLLGKYSINALTKESVILIENEKVFFKSEAVLRILKNLGFPWIFLWVLIIIPRFIRDPVYLWIAKNRFIWFGRKDTCFIPEDTFID